MPLSLLKNFFFPSKCLLCQRPLTNSSLLCPECYKFLQEEINVKTKQCEKCGKPLSLLSNSPICIDCQHRSFPYEKIATLGFYKDKLKDLIHFYKFRSRWSLSRIFYQLLQIHSSKLFFDVDYIIPIPLSKQRLSKRGYNQATLIAKQIKKIIKKPIAYNLLIRKKDTPHQSLLTKFEREKNLTDAFEVKYDAKYRHKRFLLVDDVITTGTTITEAAKALKNSKPQKIVVFAIAKAI